MAKAKQETTQVAVAQQNEVMPLFDSEMPAYLQGQAGTARGTENVGREDLLIPRIEIVQNTSPCKDETDPAYIPGATEGMLFNTVTRELYGKEAFIVPIFYRKEYLIWKKRVKGETAGKTDFKGSFPDMDSAEVELQGLENSQKYEIIDTPVHFCLLLNTKSGKVEEIVLSMSRTKAKVSKKWNSLIRMQGGDSFSRVYRLGTVREKNDFGAFFNYDVAAAGFPNVATYKQAEKLYKMIAAGEVQVRHDDGSDLATEGEGSEY